MYNDNVYVYAVIMSKRGPMSPPAQPGPASGTATQLELADERAYLLARHSQALRSGGFAVQPLPLRHPQAMLRLACLLPRASLALFILTCEALKSRLDPTYELSLSEPLAPVDFLSPHLFHSQPAASAPHVGTPAILPVSHRSAFPSAEYRLRS